jgi:hypothetical protein
MALTLGHLAIGMVTTDCANPSGLAAFWAAALGTTVSGDYGEFVMLAPPPAGGPVLGFQLVPEERAGKNRLHLDLDRSRRQRILHRGALSAPAAAGRARRRPGTGRRPPARPECAPWRRVLPGV